jgi:hypothetical protein
MNASKLTTRGERGVNDANDIHRTVDEVRKLKDVYIEFGSRITI